jgi:GNAT superfamily N-acetyltransferase
LPGRAGKPTGEGFSIRPVATRAEKRRFIRYPYRLYRGNSAWVPPLLFDERRRFDPRRNPFYEHARMELFLAESGGRVVGRVAAIDDDNHNTVHGENLLHFGFFEAENERVAAALFAAVEERARFLGREAVRGPANPSLNEGAGFQLDAYDRMPYVLTPYNLPEYPGYAEASGYRKVKDLYHWRFGREDPLGERIGRLAKRVRERYEPTVRQVDMGRYREELGVVIGLFNEAWEENWGFVGYTEREFESLIRELRLIFDPELALILEVDGEPAGVALCLPDANQIFKRANGRLLPAAFAYLNRRKIVDRLRLPILGVAEEHRNKGFEVALIYELYRRAIRKGYRECEASWILEDNRPMNRAIEAGGATLYKTCRVFQKDL